MPMISAATSEVCKARNARPAGDSMRFSASQTARSRQTPTTQYQMCSPTTAKPRSVSGGTDIPSGPPVTLSSVEITIDTMMPSPSVAIAR